MIRALAAASSRRRRNTAAGTVKFSPLAVDRSRPFDGDIFGIHRKDQPNIAVAESGVTAERNVIGGAVLLAVGAAEELAVRSDVQRDIAFHLDRADNKYTRGDQHGSSLVPM